MATAAADKRAPAAFGSSATKTSYVPPPKEPEPVKSSPPKETSASKAPSKLFKGSSTNPFAKRSPSGAAPSGGSGLGTAAGAKPDGLFYPGSQTTKPSDPVGQFSSLGSFGAGGARDNKPSNAVDGVDALRKSRDRKSSSNIEEAYSDDGFAEESLGQSQLQPGGLGTSIGKRPSALPVAPDPYENKRVDASDNLDDFSVDNGFEDKYDDDDFL